MMMCVKRSNLNNLDTEKKKKAPEKYFVFSFTAEWNELLFGGSLKKSQHFFLFVEIFSAINYD